jgi:WS/DGAT/MGAT family acyltransferase
MESLSVTEARLLELEDRRGVHMHVGCALLFDGVPPGLERFKKHVRARLHLAPRYRCRVISGAPWLGRPAWIDDPHFALDYHVRHVALPGDGDDAELARLIGTLLSQRLDRGKPLWELWLVGPLSGERFAVIGKSHAALVDGAANCDLLSVLLDDRSGEPSHERAPAWDAAPPPTPAQLLLRALADRARDPRTPLRVLRAAAAGAQHELERRDLRASGAHAAAPPPALLNTNGGLQRRYAGVEVGLGRLEKERERLGGTVNDAALTAVAGAIGRYLRLHGEDTDGLTLRALVPLADASSPRLLAGYVPLPVGMADARRRHAEISRVLDGLRAGGRVRAARELVERAGFAPPTLLAQAARLQSAERSFDLVVTNVPGPRSARHLLGHRLRAIAPAMPLAANQALSVALASHRGRLRFGLLADATALGDVELLAGLLEESLSELRKGARPKRS